MSKSKTPAKDLLFSTGTGSVPFNRTVAKAIGVDASIVLSVFVDRYYFHKSNNELVYDGWYHCTVNKLQDLSGGLSEKLQNAAIKILEDLKLIKREQKGDRGKRHIKVYIERVMSFLQDSEQLDKLIALPKKQRRSATRQPVPNEGSQPLPNEGVNPDKMDELPPPLKEPNNNQQSIKTFSSKNQSSKNQTNNLYSPLYELEGKLPREIIDYLVSRIANGLPKIKTDILINNRSVILEKWELVGEEFSTVGFKAILSVFINYDGCIVNFEKFIQGVINNKRKSLNTGSTETKVTKPIRREMIPDWMDKEYKAPEQTPERKKELDSKRKELNEALKQLREQNDSYGRAI